MMNIFTVSQLNTYLRSLLDSDEILNDIWIRGEISNFKRAASGHCYFSLKESNAVVKVAMWRSYAARLETLPNNGDDVLAHGRVSFYEAGGDLQLYVDTLRPAGVGILHARFEELRERLLNEGLFDESRKRELPFLPSRIGIATSADGAALRDILHVLNRRCPLVEIVLAPCLVQGEQAAKSIVQALEQLYHMDVDVIVLARGGGSIEDLWSFNEEIVARVVFAAPVPLITGVGHETDTTIVDYIADVRAPTPSAAAELIVPEQQTLVLAIETLRQRLATAMRQHIDQQFSLLDHHIFRLQQHEPTVRITRARQQIDEQLQHATALLNHQLVLYQTRLQGMTSRLATLSPQATLERGYALIRRAQDDQVVKRTDQVADGDVLKVTLQDGEIQVLVQGADL